MKTRRGVITVIGAAALAGCSSSTTGTQSNTDTGTEDEDVFLPLDGLGQYGEKVLDADMENSEFTAEGIQTLLEPADNVQEEAQLLAEITTPDNLYQVSNAYLSTKKEGDNTVAINQNHAFYQDSGPLLEFHTIRNGELQGQPALKAKGKTHFPDDGSNPNYLQDMREDDDWTQRVPQDYDAEERLRNDFDDWSQEEKRSRRETTQKFFSAGIFGVGPEDKVINYDAESANVLFDALYNGKNTEAAVQLSNQYAESGYAGSDVLVSAQYTDDGWTFREHPEMEIGDPLPGEDNFFDLTPQ